MPLRKIISGGQTGVDRAALDAARALGIAHGGHVPKGRWTEDGPLPHDYAVVELESANPAVRTRRNIAAADATLVITRGEPDGGTLLTLRAAAASGRPLLHVDLATGTRRQALAAIRFWLADVRPATLNVAGPRASKSPGLYQEARALLIEAFDER